MVCRITSGFHVGNLLHYHYKKGGANELIVTSLMGGATDSKGIAKVLRFRNAKNDIVKKPNIHISLNFHKDDSEDLNNGLLGAIAGEYMEKMGYGSQPYAVFRHHDKNHPHIHIISSRISEEGKKLKDSFEVYKSIRYCEMLERKYGLVVAKEQSRKLLDCGESELSKAVSEHKKSGTNALTQIMDKAIHNALGKYPENESQFKVGFEAYGLKMEKTNKGDYIYKMHKGSRNLVSNDLLAPNSDRLRGFFQENKVRKEKLLPKMKDAVLEVLEDHSKRKYKMLSFLRDGLSDCGIRLEVKRRVSGSERGRIYGYLFFDDLRKVQYSATDLGLQLRDFAFLQDDLSEEAKFKAKLQFILREKMEKGAGFYKMAQLFSKDVGVNLRLVRGGKTDAITDIGFYDKVSGREYGLQDLGWKLEKWKGYFVDDCTERAMEYDLKIRNQHLQRQRRVKKLLHSLINEQFPNKYDVLTLEQRVKSAGYDFRYAHGKFYFEHFLTDIWYDAKADFEISRWTLKDALGPMMDFLRTSEKEQDKTKNEQDKNKNNKKEAVCISENMTSLPVFLDVQKERFKNRVAKILKANLKKGDGYLDLAECLYQKGGVVLKLYRPAGLRIRDIGFYDKVSGREYRLRDLGWDMSQFKGRLKDNCRSDAVDKNVSRENRKRRFQEMLLGLSKENKNDNEKGDNEKDGGSFFLERRVLRLERAVKSIGLELVFDKEKAGFYFEHFLSGQKYDCALDFGVSKGEVKWVLGDYMAVVKNKVVKKDFRYRLTKNTLKKGQKRAKKEGLRGVMGRVYAVYNGLKKDFEEDNKKITISHFKVLLVRKGIDFQVKRADFGGEKNKIRACLFRDKKTGVTYSATDLKLKLRDFGFLEDDLKIEKGKNLEYSVDIGNVFNVFLGSGWGGEDPDPYKSVKRKKRGMDRDLGIR